MIELSGSLKTGGYRRKGEIDEGINEGVSEGVNEGTDEGMEEVIEAAGFCLDAELPEATLADL
jgi:hypothetical protein